MAGRVEQRTVSNIQILLFFNMKLYGDWPYKPVSKQKGNFIDYHDKFTIPAHL